MKSASLLFAITSMDGQARPAHAPEGFEQKLLGRIRASLEAFTREFPGSLTGDQPLDRAIEGYVLDVTIQSIDPNQFPVLNRRLGELLKQQGLRGF
jgi:hypothetical protein